jgi:hypothetical protein
MEQDHSLWDRQNVIECLSEDPHEWRSCRWVLREDGGEGKFEEKGFEEMCISLNAADKVGEEDSPSVS